VSGTIELQSTDGSSFYVYGVDDDNLARFVDGESFYYSVAFTANAGGEPVSVTCFNSPYGSTSGPNFNLIVSCQNLFSDCDIEYRTDLSANPPPTTASSTTGGGTTGGDTIGSDTIGSDTIGSDTIGGATNGAIDAGVPVLCILLSVLVLMLSI
jgi:hypothetical protein